MRSLRQCPMREREREWQTSNLCKYWIKRLKWSASRRKNKKKTGVTTTTTTITKKQQQNEDFFFLNNDLNNVIFPSFHFFYP